MNLRKLKIIVASVLAFSVAHASGAAVSSCSSGSPKIVTLPNVGQAINCLPASSWPLSIINSQIATGYVDGFGKLTITPIKNGSFKIIYDPNHCDKDGFCEEVGYSPCVSDLKDISPDSNHAGDAPYVLKINDKFSLEIDEPGSEPGVTYPVHVVPTHPQASGPSFRIPMNQVGSVPYFMNPPRDRFNQPIRFTQCDGTWKPGDYSGVEDDRMIQE